jgi:hypothetical protein
MTISGSGPERLRDLSDQELLEKVQFQSFRYYWDYGHPASGMARDRVNLMLLDKENDNNSLVTTGGTGFGIMAIIVAVERGWICREQATDRVRQIAKFLSDVADDFHGVFPHWLDANTGKIVNFSAVDDGSDLVETAYLFQGLLSARQYLNDDKVAAENELRDKIQSMWENVERTFHHYGQNALYWHWSPNFGFSKEIQGCNECMITYVLAASSPKHAIDMEVYELGWATSNTFFNGKKFYEVTYHLELISADRSFSLNIPSWD